MSLLKGPNTNTGGSALVFPQYTGIQLPTSACSLPVPITYGLTKIGVNVIYYNHFVANPIVTVSSTGVVTVVGYNYYADLIFALCEGPITGIGQVFKGNSTLLFSNSSPNPLGWTLSAWNSMSLNLGTEIQSVPTLTYNTTSPLANPALAYPGIAYAYAPGYFLGTNSAGIGSIQFEVAGRLYGTGFNSIDADPALVIQDFLTNPQYGAGFPAAELDLTRLLGASGDSSVQTYCHALGLAFSPQIVQQEPANGILTRWLQLINCDAFYSSGMLKIAPYGDLTLTGIDSTQWVAPTAPLLTLNDDAFLAKGGEDPIRVERIDPINLYTNTTIEVLNRAGVNVASALNVAQFNATLATMEALSNRSGGGTASQPQGQPQYNPTPVYARDQYMIQSVGLRQGPTVTAHEVCDLDIASRMIQLILQKQLYNRAQFKFSLSWEYCLLDPMDVVSIVDPYLFVGGSRFARIISITENDDYTLDVVCDEYTVGVGTPGYNISSGINYGSSNSSTVPNSVDTILIYEPSTSLSGGVAQIWFGASGGTFGNPDLNWGGCYVYYSLDGTHYTQLGVISGPMASGTLTASFATGTGFDTTHTLSVDTSTSGGILNSTSVADAQAGTQNLALIGGATQGELVGFETAALVGGFAYNLTNIQRGMFATTPATWPAGAAFSVLSNNILKLALPSALVGKLIYFKFPSYNTQGGGVEALSTAPVYTYQEAAGGGSQVEEFSQIVIASGASILVPIPIPAGSYILGIGVKNLSSIPGVSGYHVDPQFASGGGAGPTSGTWGSNTSTNGSTASFVPSGSLIWNTTTEIVLTFVGGSGTSGSIEVVAKYALY